MENKVITIDSPYDMAQKFPIGTILLIKGMECSVESDNNVECTTSVCKNCLLNEDGFNLYCAECTCIACDTYFKPIKK